MFLLNHLRWISTVINARPNFPADTLRCNTSANFSRKGGILKESDEWVVSIGRTDHRYCRLLRDPFKNDSVLNDGRDEFGNIDPQCHTIRALKCKPSFAIRANSVGNDRVNLNVMDYESLFGMNLNRGAVAPAPDP